MFKICVNNKPKTNKRKILEQLESFLENVTSSSNPFILGGDFNNNSLENNLLIKNKRSFIK